MRSGLSIAGTAPSKSVKRPRLSIAIGYHYGPINELASLYDGLISRRSLAFCGCNRFELFFIAQSREPNTNALSVVTNQSPVHTSGANQWSGACTFGERWSSFVPLGKGMEALRKLPRAFCGRGSPSCLRPPMVPLLKGDKDSKPFCHWSGQGQT